MELVVVTRLAAGGNILAASALGCILTPPPWAARGRRDGYRSDHVGRRRFLEHRRINNNWVPELNMFRALMKYKCNERGPSDDTCTRAAFNVKVREQSQELFEIPVSARTIRLTKPGGIVRNPRFRAPAVTTEQ